MKKVLLGTSAIALAGAFATQAVAAEWEVDVGGYYEAHTGFAESDNTNIPGEFDGVDVKTDAEVHFSPSITLDNGIKIGARIELEGATSSDQIDENYVYVSGSFGQLMLGENDPVSYDMSYAAPNVTFVGINSGDDVLYLPFADAFGTTTTFVEVTGDHSSIRYTTPRLAGFQLGVSYARDAKLATNDDQQNTDTTLSDIWAAGANYVNSFGDFNIAASGVYNTGSLDGHNGNDPEVWAVGLNVGYAGFTVGGSCSDFNKAAGNMETWDAGVSYATGPWGFSFTYLHADKADSHDGEIDKYQLGINYDLAQGVRLGAFGTYVEADSDHNAASYDGDGFIIGTGIRVSF